MSAPVVTPMRACYDVSPEDLFAVHMEAGKPLHQRALRQGRVSVLIVFATLGGIFGFLLYKGAARPGGGVGWPAAAAGITAVLWLIVGARAQSAKAFHERVRKFFFDAQARGDFGPLTSPNEVVLGEEGLAVSDTDMSAMYSWRSVERVWRGPAHLFVRFRSKTVLCIPARAFGDAREVEAFAREIERRRDLAVAAESDCA